MTTRHASTAVTPDLQRVVASTSFHGARRSRLPTPWSLYNLASSPFARSNEATAEPSRSQDADALVGRDAALCQLRSTIRQAAASSSHQAVVGPVGVGKAAIVHALKLALLEEGYLVTDAVTIAPGDPAQQLFGAIVGVLYEAVLGHRPHLLGHPAMRAARHVVRAERADAHLQPSGEHDPFNRFWAGVRSGTTALGESELLEAGPRLVRDLVALALEAGARGVLLDLRYHEHASGPAMADAADILRALHETVLTCEGLHSVVVGSAETVCGILASSEPLTTAFPACAVDALPIADVHSMLDARYERVRLDPSRPAMPPVERAVVAELHALFRGDLRGLLAALHDGATPLLGVAGIVGDVDQDTAASTPVALVRPLTSEELRPMLQARYAARLATLPERHRVHQLTRWGVRDPAGTYTQRSLMKLWGASQAAVSHTMAHLIRKGFVLTLPRADGEATRYVLSGVSRLIFG